MEFQYANDEIRRKRTNYANILGLTVVCTIMLLLFALQFAAGMPGISVVLGIPLAAVTLVVCWAVYLKNPFSSVYYMVELVFFSITYTVVLLTSSLQMVFIYVIPIMIGTLLYDNYKLFRAFCIGVWLLNAVRSAVMLVTVWGTPRSDEISAYVLQVLLMGIVAIAAQTACRLRVFFTRDISGKMRQEQGKQEHMLNNVLEIADHVKSGTDDVNAVMEELQESTVAMHQSFHEISMSTQVTAESIQEQTEKTREIQDAINAATELSKDIVDITTHSNQAIRGGMDTMESMKSQSVVIQDANTQVAVSMDQLQNKTKEVQSIANMIFEISEQTNLLALNASIESARAGEAGRGFAVVADQIRQLAEQTRHSTESIAAIIEELDGTANVVAERVKSSMTVTSRQNELLEVASKQFNVLDGNIHALSNNIQEMDDKISHLMESNNFIVESISQLSATSEEVTASADLATELSEKNKERFIQTKELLGEVVGTTHKLDQYYVN